MWKNDEPPPTLQLTGTAETYPSGVGEISTANLIAKVSVNGQPKQGVSVNFKVDVEAGTGGHSHGDGGSLARPKGGLNLYGGTTDAKGEIKLTFSAAEPAGLHRATASCPQSQCGNAAEHRIEVKVPNLVAIAPDTQSPARYTLVGTTTNHPSSHYLSGDAIRVLNDIVETFNTLGWTPVGINDASLAWGGMFDIKGRWLDTYLNSKGEKVTGGHAEHRKGQQVDVSFNRPASVSNDLRKRAYDEVCTNDRAALSPDILWHKNDGYVPHFHIYLMGKSGAAATSTNHQCSAK